MRPTESRGDELGDETMSTLHIEDAGSCVVIGHSWMGRLGVLTPGPRIDAATNTHAAIDAIRIELASGVACDLIDEATHWDHDREHLFGSLPGDDLIAALIREANPSDDLPGDDDDLLAACRHNIAEEAWILAPRAARQAGDAAEVRRLQAMLASDQKRWAQ